MRVEVLTVTYPVFVAKDRLGLPLDQAIDHVIKTRGWSLDACLTDFTLGAAQAGWSEKAVRRDVREVIADLGGFYPCHEVWKFWADGSFNRE